MGYTAGQRRHGNSPKFKKEAYKFLTTSFSKRGLRNNLDKNQKTEKKGKKVIEKRKEGKTNKRKKQFKESF